MGIVTKRGDRGMTSLCFGPRVYKDDVRVEACGALDEVSSFLGLAKSISCDRNTKKIVSLVQKELITICAEIATPLPAIKKLKKRVKKYSVCALEKEICGLENKCMIKMRSFAVPGKNVSSSALDIARAITRRAERRCVTMARFGMINNDNIITYLNRLSDLLYLLARLNEKNKK